MDRAKMAKRYVKEKGIKNIEKLNALINILQKVDES